MQPHTPKKFSTALFEAAVRVTDPLAGMRLSLPAPGLGRTVVIGAGKASAQMAKRLETLWPGTPEGAAVTRYGQALPCDRIEVLGAAHPVPDAAGLKAAGRLTALIW